MINPFDKAMAKGFYGSAVAVGVGKTTKLRFVRVFFLHASGWGACW